MESCKRLSASFRSQSRSKKGNFCILVNFSPNSPFTAAGRTGVLNNTMVEVVDELADTFDGTYKVEESAFFALATD